MAFLTKHSLNFFDFVILSLIFFGYFSMVSVWGYFGTPVLDPISASSFNENSNWITIFIELFFLCGAGLYLRWRKFDWSLINIECNKYTLPLVVFLVLGGALTTDTVLYGGYWLSTGENPFVFESSGEFLPSLFGHISLGLLLFSLLNGFYEELFFMGLAFAVNPKHRLYALIFSVFVRFIFHIYQGLLAAIAIALTGVVFILIRHKIRTIVPFMLAHSVFDIFGAGILVFFLY